MRLLIATMLVMLCASPAQAHRSTTSRVHNIRHIAQSVWGDVCDVGTMNVPIVKRAGSFGIFKHSPHDAGPPYTACRIEIDSRPISTRSVCLVLLHAFGQAAGEPDSADPQSIMYPKLVTTYAPCENGAASTTSRGLLPPPRAAPAAPSVILLPAGGWRVSNPAVMQPWVDDFRAHGIPARAISYPVGDVVAAIDYVARVVAAEPGPVVVYGVSAGGTIAAALAAEGLVRGAVNVIGPTDFTRWTALGVVYMQQIGMTTYAQRRAASPYWRLTHPAPQLQQCGLADPIVTFEQCARYDTAARRLQPDTTLQPLVNWHGQTAAERADARRWVEHHLGGQ